MKNALRLWLFGGPTVGQLPDHEWLELDGVDGPAVRRHGNVVRVLQASRYLNVENRVNYGLTVTRLFASPKSIGFNADPDPAF